MTPSKPIVLVNHLVEPPGRITGISRYAFGLLSAWLRRGDTRLVLATTFSRDQLPEDIAAGVDEIVTLPYIASTPINNLRQRRALREVANRIKPNVVYATNPMCPPVRGIPSVITLHDLYYEILGELYTRRHRLWWRLFFTDASRRAARIACASQNTADDAVRLHPHLRGKTRVVAGAGVLPLGDADLPALVPREPYILLLGNVTPNKNAPFLIDALRLLAAQGRPVKALHAGRDLTGDLAHALSEGGDALLQPLGGLPDAELDAVLRNAAALVQPSRYEGFGLPIVEAQERGVPVIASDIAVFRDVTGDGGRLVALGDTSALAQAIHDMTTNAAMRDELAARARINAKRFTWANSAQAAADIVHELSKAAK